MKGKIQSQHLFVKVAVPQLLIQQKVAVKLQPILAKGAVKLRLILSRLQPNLLKVAVRCGRIQQKHTVYYDHCMLPHASFFERRHPNPIQRLLANTFLKKYEKLNTHHSQDSQSFHWNKRLFSQVLCVGSTVAAYVSTVYILCSQTKLRSFFKNRRTKNECGDHACLDFSLYHIVYRKSVHLQWALFIKIWRTQIF